MELVFAGVVFAVIAVWALLSGALPQETPPQAPEAVVPEPPPPILVDLRRLSVEVDLAMNAVENDLRMRQLVHEAEGARQMRATVKKVLQGSQG
jgi:hypothetical protein